MFQRPGRYCKLVSIEVSKRTNVEEEQSVEDSLDSPWYSLSGVLCLAQSSGNDLCSNERESSLNQNGPESQELSPSPRDEVSSIRVGVRVQRDVVERPRVSPVSIISSVCGPITR
jgi:hypothetical protein